MVGLVNWNGTGRAVAAQLKTAFIWILLDLGTYISTYNSAKLIYTN